MQAAEKLVEKLTSEITKLDKMLADPALYQDAAKAQKLSMERGQLARRLAEAEEAWLLAGEGLRERFCCRRGFACVSAGTDRVRPKHDNGFSTALLEKLNSDSPQVKCRRR